MLRPDEDPFAIVEFELNALIPTDVVRLSIPSMANAPSAVLDNRTVGSRLIAFDGIKRESQEREVEREETNVNAIPISSHSATMRPSGVGFFS
jgi:hypothetical protein